MKLKIRVGSIEFEADGNEAEVERERTAMTNFLERLAAVDPNVVSPYHTPRENQYSTLIESNTDTAYQSFNEFLKATAAKRDTDMIMAAAYFLYKYRAMDCFTSKDIEELLAESHIKRPGNISQAIAQNIKKCFIAQIKSSEPGLKAYQVLTTADEWFNDIRTNAG